MAVTAVLVNIHHPSKKIAETAVLDPTWSRDGRFFIQ